MKYKKPNLSLRVLLLAGLTLTVAVAALADAPRRILKPVNRGAAYDVAASEFQKYYERVCGERLEIVTEWNDQDDYVVIGGDMVNRFVRRLVEEKALDDFSIGVDSDEYRLLSVTNGERNHLILAGGRGRSTLYAVYEFFEHRCGCRWFWDGDVVPRRETIDLAGLDLRIKPRFEYRGIRYFAHRGLSRFQAEHWGIDDWKKEIDWCVKRRLNLVMLRIGQDDLFQKAFPDIVPYPDPSKPLPSMGTGYDNRNLFWPLEFRGRLRKQIMDYAFERDLMHPEDFGTMTHWYSPTPQEFLDKVRPTSSAQSSGYGLKTQAVWDIREDKNLDNYWKITQASIDHYGKPEIFHTIGFAERMVYDNRDDNFKMKVYFYRRMIENLRAHYPNAPVLLAGWDFYGWWNQEEIQKLLAQMDPEKTLILDYTLDLENDAMTGGNNFAHWDIIGKFPYIAGLFLAYESALDIRGRYDLFQKNQKRAFDDPMCKGFVLWPESSHTDIFMLDYFTNNAWKPGEATPDELLTEFCRDRYGRQSEAFLSLWRDVMKPSQLLTAAWNFWSVFTQDKTAWDDAASWESEFERQRPILEVAPSMFERLAQIEWSDEFARRDSVDLARTLADRLLTLVRIRVLRDVNRWRSGALKPERAAASIDAFERLAESMTELLALHEDYSMNDTFRRTNEIEPIRNPDFGRVLIDNATNGYCMSHQYESAAHWYLPTFRLMARLERERLASDRKDGFAEEREKVVQERGALRKKMLETPLPEMAPRSTRTHSAFVETMTKMADAARTIVEETTQ